MGSQCSTITGLRETSTQAGRQATKSAISPLQLHKHRLLFTVSLDGVKTKVAIVLFSFNAVALDVRALIRVSLPARRQASKRESIQDAGRHGATPTGLRLRGSSSPPQTYTDPRRISATRFTAAPNLQRRPARTFTNTNNKLRCISLLVAHHRQHELAIPNPIPEQSPPHSDLFHKLYQWHPEPLQ